MIQYVIFLLCSLELQRLHESQIDDINQAHKQEIEDLKAQHAEEIKKLLVGPNTEPHLSLYCMILLT